MKKALAFAALALVALNVSAKAQAVFAGSDYTCTTQRVGIFTNTDCTNGYHSESQVIGIFTYTDGVNARGKKFHCEAQKIGITVETDCHVTDQ
ncbi:hypothetical protein [Rhodoblastus sp.]|uniref:hypothetical protein n=1 Tax=Rhodoblastus sp. TaxID=1962975 RepID=UPI00262C0AED|nr:hypothetical protein [Rhodoblastus sp.]